MLAFHLQIPLVLLTPSSFAIRPESWLWAISRFRATCSAGPNSAYHACATIEDDRLRGLDLSSWRAALNGSELVGADTSLSFCQRYEPHGFSRVALMPVYGLAENTIATTFPEYGKFFLADSLDRHVLEVDGRAVLADSDDVRSRKVVSVGRPLHGQEVRLVGANDGIPLDTECVVGAVEVKGPCVMHGYYGDAAHTAETIRDGGWLRTGDLGYLREGRLYIVGRAKDVIVRAGRKYHASDIQAVARSVQGVRRGLCAAFGVPSEIGTERLVIMVESVFRNEKSHKELRIELSRRIYESLLVHPDEVVVVPPGTVPRTTSGKIQHTRAKHIYMRSMTAVAIQADLA